MIIRSKDFQLTYCFFLMCSLFTFAFSIYLFFPPPPTPQTCLLDLKEHASSLASSGLKKDSKLKSLEITLEQKKEECLKLENHLKRVRPWQRQRKRMKIAVFYAAILHTFKKRDVIHFLLHKPSVDGELPGIKT